MRPSEYLALTWKIHAFPRANSARQRQLDRD